MLKKLDLWFWNYIEKPLWRIYLERKRRARRERIGLSG